ncbi:MAG: hypothetical protein ABIQ16_03075 [Polyangiaceae bacterium]
MSPQELEPALPLTPLDPPLWFVDPPLVDPPFVDPPFVDPPLLIVSLLPPDPSAPAAPPGAEAALPPEPLPPTSRPPAPAPLPCVPRPADPFAFGSGAALSLAPQAVIIGSAVRSARTARIAND